MKTFLERGRDLWRKEVDAERDQTIPEVVEENGS
jgi:hypothetical protein